MSRYSLKPLPQRSDVFEVAVGWDAALGTFFVMVFGATDAGRDPNVLYWKGGQLRQLLTVEELHDVVAPYAEIPLELARRLVNDQCDQQANPPRQWSQFISDLLGNSTA